MNMKKTIDEAVNWSPVTKKWGPLWGRLAYAGLALILIIVLLAALIPGSDVTQGSRWAEVRRGSITVDITESGEVKAVSENIISAPMMWSASLQITGLIDEGTFVEVGDTLIQFDPADVITELDLARDRVVTLRADLDKLKSQQRLTIYNQEKALQLSQYAFDQANIRLEIRKFESEAKQEEARLQLKKAEIDLKKQQKQLESQKIIHNGELLKKRLEIKQAENRWNDRRNRLELFTITSPAQGIVVYKEVGDWNSRERLKKGYSAEPREELLSIPDLSRMQIRLFINEVDRFKIHPGIDAHITLDAFPEAEFKGQVRDVAVLAQKVNYSSNLRGFLAFIDVNESDPRLKPGITAKVTIQLETHEDKLIVPIGAVFERGGEPVVCLNRTGRIIPVELGLRNDREVIIEEGVKEGMKLAWTPPPGAGIYQLGRAEEQRRIEEIGKTLIQSFAVFEERGILHDYAKTVGGEKEDKGAAKKLDIGKLPPALRERLESGEDLQKIPVENPDDGGEIKSIKITPDMIKKMEAK